MEKQDLRTGMQVEQRYGTRKVVLLGTMSGDVIVEVGGNGYGELSSYSNDLTANYDNEFDIMKIYESSEPSSYLITNFGKEDLIWERTPEIEINIKINDKESTLKDISEETLLNIRKLS